jgi:hypothetical protein
MYFYHSNPVWVTELQIQRTKYGFYCAAFFSIKPPITLSAIYTTAVQFNVHYIPKTCTYVEVMWAEGSISDIVSISVSSLFCKNMHTYIHTYIHTYTHTYIHTYIHTHTHEGWYQTVRLSFTPALIIVLMMKAPNISETSVNFSQPTRCNNPEDSHLHIRRPEHLKSQRWQGCGETVGRSNNLRAASSSSLTQWTDKTGSSKTRAESETTRFEN